MKIDSEQWRQTVIQGALSLGITVTAAQARSMQRHALDLLQWNRVTNLTAITDPREVAVKHYVDALAVVPWIGKAARVLDAGSGGGFPGIPMKILRPDVSVILLDSVRKKVSFLKHAIRTLGLGDIAAVHSRLETLAEQKQYRRQFDTVVCRAFGSLPDFVRMTRGCLAPGGTLLALKGPQVEKDRGIGRRADGPIIQSGNRSFSVQFQRYHLPVLHARRCVVRLTLLADD
jgi:16S rRNA (guanine527-N7)-methyltransferase